MIKSIFKIPVQYSKTSYSRELTNKQHVPTILFRSPITLFHINYNPKRFSFMDQTMIINNDDETLSKAHKICSEHLGGSWCRVSPREMSLVPISGGMSNAVYCCSLPESISLDDNEPSQVLLRFYGDQSKKYNTDISTQLEIFCLLSMKNLGPKLYGKFDDGRLEEFIQAESLTNIELMSHEISSIIAKKVAAIHDLDIGIDKLDTWLEDKLDEWIHMTKEKKLSTLSDDLRESTVQISQELLAIDFDAEIRFIKSVIKQTSSPIVFSHNDLHQGNILLAKYSKRRPTLDERLVLIDFEYSSYNYRAFDIANHFCEWCFDYDTPDYPHFVFQKENFPSLDAQRNFLSYYLNGSNDLVTSSEINKNGVLNGNNNASHIVDRKINHHSNDNNQNIENLDEDTLLKEIKPFFMIPNFLWTIWCINNSYSENTKFGYWEHAMARWKLYLSLKQSYIEEMKLKSHGEDLE